MKCISCDIEVDPKWKHSIETNVCPFCGKTILNEKLQELLSALSGVFEALQEFPDQLQDWLYSNYNYVPESSIQKQSKQINISSQEEKKLNPIFEKHNIKIIKKPKEEELQDIVNQISNENEEDEFSMTDEDINAKLLNDFQNSKTLASSTRFR